LHALELILSTAKKPKTKKHPKSISREIYNMGSQSLLRSLVAHSYDPSYSGGRDWKDQSSG
jgi:hypothetical protein